MSNKDKHHCPDANELLKRTALNIQKYGLQVIMVSGSSYLPSFAYSIGLSETYKHPEIICFGLGNELGHAIINDVAQLIKNGEHIDITKQYEEIFEGSRAAFLKVDRRNIADYFGTAQRYFKNKPFRALQLVWTDRNDKFPWEEGFEEEFQYKQPLLDRSADFKFREQKNRCVFSTRQWLELDEPILHVFHDHDGDWQFLTGNQLPEDGRVVALEEMILKDPSLNELFDLEYGEEAERQRLGGEWKRNKTKQEEE